MNLSHYNQINLLGADIMLEGLLEESDRSYTILREIAPLIKDTDFEDMYKEGGRPPVSPRVLLLTTIMQYLERLPDRAAAENLRFRLDWKIAFSLPIDFEGIHHTTLVYFRDRLLENKKASLAFDKILEHLKEVGLVKRKMKQRIDSTHIIGNVRELSRIELLHETLRLFCKEANSYLVNVDKKLKGYLELYSEKISIKGISDAQKRKLIKDAGQTMRAFIELSRHKSFEDIQHLDSYKTLVTVFEQNFEDSPDPDDGPKLIKIATGKDHISSPHEAEARFGNKGKKKWLGYKAQVVETVSEEEDGVNFITHIEVNNTTDFDGAVVEEIVEDLVDKEVEPSELYGDTHYNTGDNIRSLNKKDIEIKGPVMPISENRKERNKGFKVLEEERKAICPEGVESKRYSEQRNGLIYIAFPREACDECPRRAICKPEKYGRIYTARPQDKEVTKRRREMETEEFKKDMHKRNGVEGTISGLVRGQGARRSRYRGKAKTNLHLKLAGATANILRLHRYREIKRKNVEKQMMEEFKKLLKTA